MPAPWIVQAALTGAVLIVAVAMYVWAKVLRRDDPALWPLVLIFFLGLLIWVPPVVRDPGGALLLGLIVAIFPDRKTSKLLLAFAVGVPVLLLASVVPGGVSAIVLLPVALLVGLVTHGELQHMLRLRRARALQPGQRPKGEVAVGGTVVERSVAAPSGIDAVTAAWQMSWSDAQESDCPFGASPPLLEVQCDHGQVLVDLQTVSINMDSNQHAAVEAEQGRAIATQLGLPSVGSEQSAPRPAAPSAGTDSSGESPAEPSGGVDSESHQPGASSGAAIRRTGFLRWFVPGQEVFVVGLPQWEGGHGSAGYRDGSLVPVFRNGPEHSAWLADHGEAEASTRARWSVAQGIVWGSTCALIAIVQILGFAN